LFLSWPWQALQTLSLSPEQMTNCWICRPHSQEKVAFLRSQAEMELTSARQRLEQVQQQADAARAAFRHHLQGALE
jgi:hypothetical protein